MTLFAAIAALIRIMEWNTVTVIHSDGADLGKFDFLFITLINA